MNALRIAFEIEAVAIEFVEWNAALGIDAEFKCRRAVDTAVSRIAPRRSQMNRVYGHVVLYGLNEEPAAHATAQIRGVEGVDADAFDFDRGRVGSQPLPARIEDREDRDASQGDANSSKPPTRLNEADQGNNGTDDSSDGRKIREERVHGAKPWGHGRGSVDGPPAD